METNKKLKNEEEPVIKETKLSFDSIAKKMDRLMAKKQKLSDKKQKFEDLISQNDELKDYLNVVIELQDLEKDIKNYKDGELYDAFNEHEIDYFEGNHCTISFKKPYSRLKFKQKDFLKDYGEKTKMYNKYIEKQLIKGTVTVTDLH